MIYDRSRDKKWSSGGFIDRSLRRVRDISSRTRYSNGSSGAVATSPQGRRGAQACIEQGGQVERS